MVYELFHHVVIRMLQRRHGSFKTPWYVTRSRPIVTYDFQMCFYSMLRSPQIFGYLKCYSKPVSVLQYTDVSAFSDTRLPARQLGFKQIPGKSIVCEINITYVFHDAHMIVFLKGVEVL